MLYTIVHFFTNKRCALSLYISAWAISALLVQTSVGNAKAFVERGRVTGTDSRAFSFLYGLFIIYLEPSGSGICGLFIYIMDKRRLTIFILEKGISFIFCLLFMSCDPINTVLDPNFTQEGNYIGETSETFVVSQPSQVNFYVEVSGSMNGFFRANKATEFKDDVWSIVSNFGNPGVSVLSNQGTVLKKYSSNDFQKRMISGSFVSAASTKVPVMMETILQDLNYNNGACSVLISDMKYSPVGTAGMPVLLSMYQTDVRNLVGKYEGLSISIIAATSDYLGNKMNCPDSPYYYVIMGRDKEVAYLRNRIITLLEKNKNYVDSIEMGFDYKSPAFTFGISNNCIQLGNEPCFTDYDCSYNDTCSVKLNLDLSDFRWTIADENMLRQNFMVKSAYGASVEIGKITLEVDNHYNREFVRKAIANIELKVNNMPNDSDVILWYLNHPDQYMNETLLDYLSGQEENDCTKSFSVDKFIGGIFNAIQNKWTKEPNRILISKSRQ